VSISSGTLSGEFVFLHADGGSGMRSLPLLFRLHHIIVTLCFQSPFLSHLLYSSLCSMSPTGQLPPGPGRAATISRCNLYDFRLLRCFSDVNVASIFRVEVRRVFMHVQGVTERCEQILGMSFSYQNKKKKWPYQHVSGGICELAESVDGCLDTGRRHPFLYWGSCG
jgi:hypothetical protein